MESLDRKIVLALASDSQQSLADLAAQLEIPISTLHQRVKRLESRGVITGYHAKLDKRLLGLKLSALV